MSDDAKQNPILTTPVVYRIPGMDQVTVRRDIPYANYGEDVLTMDVYYPVDSAGSRELPLVIFVLGYSDLGFQKLFGRNAREMKPYVSWAQLTAASGIAAITYTNREPVTDIEAVLEYVRQNAPSLGIDPNRIGIWACSGNVPTALHLLIQAPAAELKCAVLCYGMMLDPEGAGWVQEAAEQWGFRNPCVGKSIDDLPRDLPLFIARAGRDQFPHLNDTLDHFISGALTRNLRVTLVNHSEGPHAFDIFDDTDTSKEIVRQILGFMRFHLSR